MNSFSYNIERLHAPIRIFLLQLILIGVALFHFVMLMWEPRVYVEQIGGFHIINGMLFIYAICSSFIYGVGFIPVYWLWNLFFSPYIAITVLGYFNYLYFFS